MAKALFCKVAANKLHSDSAALTSAPRFCDAHVDADGYVDFSPPRVLAAMK